MNFPCPRLICRALSNVCIIITCVVYQFELRGVDPISCHQLSVLDLSSLDYLIALSTHRYTYQRFASLGEFGCGNRPTDCKASPLKSFAIPVDFCKAALRNAQKISVKSVKKS